MAQKEIPYKIYLEESEMPRDWYNVRADMAKKLDEVDELIAKATTTKPFNRYLTLLAGMLAAGGFAIFCKFSLFYVNITANFSDFAQYKGKRATNCSNSFTNSKRSKTHYFSHIFAHSDMEGNCPDNLSNDDI